MKRVRKSSILVAVLSALLMMLAPFAPSRTALSVRSSIDIRLRYATFDPLAGEPDIPSGQRMVVRDDRPNTYLVQFSGPVRQEWKDATERVGARLYGYIPDYAFIARMTPAMAEHVRSLTFVRWVGPYHPAYRMAPALRTQSALHDARPITVTVQTLPDVSLDDLSSRIEVLGGKVKGRDANPTAGYLRVTIPSNRVEGVAALDGVLWVEPYFEPELYNDVGGGQIMRANDVRGSLGLYGSGQIVSVADTGLDTGNSSTLHPDVRGRVLKTYCLGRPSPCDWSDYVGHGTHVAGSVLGNGLVSGSNPAAHQYANSYAGVAPEARLIFQSIGDAQGHLGGIPDDEGDLMRTAYNDGARIHTNSWGGPTGGTVSHPEYGGYTISSQQVDQAMWEHKDMLVLFAAGNSGIDENKDGVVDLDSIGQPGTAKNVLTVGASENQRSSIARVWGNSYGPPISTDRRADNPDGMAAFSSRGPTDDGRIKPDIVAPGTYIVSMRTRRYAFTDDMESANTPDLYTKLSTNGGTGNSWQWVTDDPHSPSHYWKDTVSGSYNPGAMSILLTPVMNVWPTGDFNITIWHKYILGGDNKMVVILTDNDLSPAFTFVLDTSGSQNTYQPLVIGPFPTTMCTQQGECIDPSHFGVGFGIYSESGNYNSQWWVDDIRADGASWGTLSSVGLASPGDAEDEAYVTMGGTSMATPLTAGASAIVREWLTRIKGVSNPSAALMKGILLNGAADMTPGQYGAGASREIPATRPNNVTGWGRVDLVGSLDPPSPGKIWFKENTTGLGTGSTAVYTLTIGASQSQGIGTKGEPHEGSGAHLVDRSPNGAPPFAGSGATRPLGTSQLLQNPGFETGSWYPWETYGSPSLTNIIKHGGSWSAHLGNYNYADDEIWQQVNIPSVLSSLTIDFWYRLRTDETYTGSDYFCYGVWSASGSTAYVKRCLDIGAVGDRDWARETYSLTPSELIQVVGETVLFGFYVITDGSLPSRVWVDDTALYVTSSGVTPTPTSAPPTSTPRPPSPTPTPTPAVPTPTPGSCPQAITDGGFEQATGDFSHPKWNVSGNARFTRNEGIAHTGQNAAILGYTSNPATGDLWQSVGVPADSSSATLSFWYQTMGDGSFHVDVDVVNSSGSTTLAHLTTLTSAGFDWHRYSHSFTPGELYNIAGKNVRLRFRISGVSDPEDVVVDDVSWTICTGGGPAPTPTPAPSGGAFHVTLAWTDYPGEPAAAKALVNDLDLEVIAPDGTHYYGNQGVYTSGQCLRNQKWDACNNVEGIVIPGAPYGTYTVVVHGANVPHGPQPFALVASGDNLCEGSSPPPTGGNLVYLPLVAKH